jgi:hypothetical protein
MRGVVIAKMLVLALWGLYLAIGLTQATGIASQQTGSLSRTAAPNSSL